MATVSCIVITTLIVVSLANLLLLVHVIMHSLSKCEQNSGIMKKISKIPRRESSLISTRKTSDDKYKFMGALMVLFQDENFEFVCGVAIVSKKWVMTSAYCVEPVLSEDLERVKIASSIQKMKYGLWYDVHKIKIHEKYKSPLANNLALISIQQVFKDKETNSVPLPSLNYKYLGNSNATAVGWENTDLITIEVKLLPYQNCQASYEKISEDHFCTEKKFCLLDFGGFLIQKDTLIGIIAFGVGCGGKPVLYTRMSMFEEWFRKGKIAAIFKD